MDFKNANIFIEKECYFQIFGGKMSFLDTVARASKNFLMSFALALLFVEGPAMRAESSEDMADEEAVAAKKEVKKEEKKKKVAKKEDKKEGKAVEKKSLKPHKSKKVPAKKGKKGKKKEGKRSHDRKTRLKKRTAFLREKAFNATMIQQNEHKIASLEERDKAISPRIQNVSKEIKTLKSDKKTAEDARKGAVKERTSLSRDRQSMLRDMKGDMYKETKLKVDALTKQVSAKMAERDKLTNEISQLERDIHNKNCEHNDLNAELKSNANNAFRLKKENRKFVKLNEALVEKIRELEVEEKAESLTVPISMFE